MFLPHDLSTTASQQRLCRQLVLYRAEVSRAEDCYSRVLDSAVGGGHG
jgi:hypothetical protein